MLRVFHISPYLNWLIRNRNEISSAKETTIWGRADKKQ